MTNTKEVNDLKETEIEKEKILKMFSRINEIAADEKKSCSFGQNEMLEFGFWLNEFTGFSLSEKELEKAWEVAKSLNKIGSKSGVRADITGEAIYPGLNAGYEYLRKKVLDQKGNMTRDIQPDALREIYGLENMVEEYYHELLSINSRDEEAEIEVLEGYGNLLSAVYLKLMDFGGLEQDTGSLGKQIKTSIDYVKERRKEKMKREEK